MATASSNQGVSESSPADLEANTNRQSDAIPSSDNNSNPKKGGRFGMLRNSFSKKDKPETTGDAAGKKKSKTSKKDKKKTSTASESSDMAQVPPLRRQKSSQSSIASTLVRKISFGKVKSKPVVGSTSATTYDSSSPSITPTVSTETLDIVPVPGSGNCSPSTSSSTLKVEGAVPSEEPGESKPYSASTSKELAASGQTPTMSEPERQPSTRDQILSITTPLMEKQKLEPPPVTTPSPSSSKAEVFLTPQYTLSPSSSESGDAAGSFSSTETSFKTPEGVSSVDEVIEDPRSYLAVASSSAAPAAMGDKREHLYKILVIGELGTGKTSIIKRYVHQFFSQHYRATIGVDFALKVLNWDANTIIRLQLWDIAGQERFGNMTRVYYKEAVGAFIVFDVTRAATFDAVVKWKQDLDSKVQLPDGSPIPCVLLANKCDQQKEGLVNNPGKMDEYCRERGFSGWFETSAKENINIEEAARSLVAKILENDTLAHQSEARSKDGDRFNLGGTKKGDGDETKSKCSC